MLLLVVAFFLGILNGRLRKTDEIPENQRCIFMETNGMMAFFIPLLLVETVSALARVSMVPSWVQKAGGLKFDCTGCGDCCKVDSRICGA